MKLFLFNFSVYVHWQQFLQILWIFLKYHVLYMIRYSKSPQFYVVKHYPTIVPQFVDSPFTDCWTAHLYLWDTLPHCDALFIHSYVTDFLPTNLITWKMFFQMFFLFNITYISSLVFPWSNVFKTCGGKQIQNELIFFVK